MTHENEFIDDPSINEEIADSENNADSEETPQTNQSRRTAPTRRVFPQNTIEEALSVIRTLKEYNGGNPWTGEEIAPILGKGAKTSDLYYLTASSRDYGMTEGTSRTKSIEITSIGKEYLFAASPMAERAALEKAFFNVSIFKNVYEYYHGSNLPEMKYLQNTLEGTFGLDRSLHQDFYRIFLDNCRFLDQVAITSSTEGTKSGTIVIVPQRPALSISPVDGVRTFVIMPFTEKTGVYPFGFYQEVFRNLITPAAEEAGFKIYSAQRDGSDIIHSTIINELLEAELVIADLTEHNPNVLFELGFRMAQDKPVALIRARGTAPIFDVDNLLRVWDYSPNLWKSTLEKDIPAFTQHLKGTWDNRASNRTYKKILSGQIT